MNRTRALAAVLFLAAEALPMAASAQNLEAGKSPGQLFSSNCSECHKSARGLLRTVPPGSLPGFLREHYTTSRDMAQQLSGFLIANGATDPRARQEIRDPRAGRPDPRQQPPAADTRAPAAADPRLARPAEPEQIRPQRPIEQEQTARPPDAPPQATQQPPEPRLSRREQRAKQREAERAARAAASQQAASERETARKDKKGRVRITPARIEAVSERGKQALPLGEAVKSEPAAEAPKPETPVEIAKPEATTPAPVDTPPPEAPATRADPVPQVTPASPAPAAVSSPAPAEKRPGEAGAGMVVSPPAAAVPEPAPAPPPPHSAPPVPPISN